MKNNISIIIPMYNASETIGNCLDAIYSSTKKPYEVVVVDDCSKDGSIEIAKKFPCRLIELKKNRGPAFARNKGAEKAKGNILFFLDADVILEKDAIEIAYKMFENPKTDAITGIYSKEPANKDVFSWYKSFYKFSNWTKTKQKTFSSFPTRMSGIKKDIFEKIGGFNPKYKGPDTEDYEFGYRLAETSKVILNKYIQGKHYFPSFSLCAKNYFKRSFQWFRFFIKRKKFDNVTTTASQGFSIASSFLGIFLLFLSFIFIMFSYNLFLLFFFISIALLGIFFYENIHFYKLCYERGIFFTLYAIVVSYLLSFVVGFGISLSIISYVFKR